MPEDRRVVAIIAAYNEGDVIASSIEDLVNQGIQVYLIDHRSTDDTVSRASRFLGHGLIHIERFPDESGFPPDDAERFAWEHILMRKTALARELDADWFVHHDADEFRESPWAHLTFRQGIDLVDRLGYNAIDFEVLHFRPTGEIFTPGDDVREAFLWHEPAAVFDKRQVKCWKRDAAVDLASSGGHEAEFPDRKVFPLRFLLRHYPIRGQAHGERKVFHERRNRFADAERARGWHVQYDHIGTVHSFIHDRAGLVKYNADAVRVGLALHHRGVEELEQALDSTRKTFAEKLDDRDRALADRDRTLADRDRVLADRMLDITVLGAQSAERGRQIDELAQHLRTLDRQIEDHLRTIQTLSDDVIARDARIAELTAGHDATLATLADIYASRSWRYTALLRRGGPGRSRADE